MKSQVYLQWTKINGSFVNWDVFCECLFVSQFWEFSSHSRIFHSYGNVTITGEGLHILTCARNSWPLSSEGSLACHTYCDTVIHLYWSSSKTRDTHTLCRAFSCGAVTTCKHHLRLSRLGFEHPPFRIRGKRSNRLRHCHSFLWVREANMQYLP